MSKAKLEGVYINCASQCVHSDQVAVYVVVTVRREV